MFCLGIFRYMEFKGITKQVKKKDGKKEPNRPLIPLASLEHGGTQECPVMSFCFSYLLLSHHL